MDDLTRRTAADIAEALDDGRDVAEFVAHALCQVAADEGGIEEVLRNRSGSWEAGHVRSLMEGTVGPDGEGLAMYRKAAEPEPGLCDAELRSSKGTWRLDVRVPALLLTGGWPTTEFTDHDATAPTVAERNEALAALGYRPADPDRVGWTWIEAQESPDQPVYFIAHTQVRPLDPQASASGE
ncbi:DUF6303 family protein [Streptomyces ureilyticus]|uniref:Uncharacterized protein n=1 Tax=Streptomyces ureilyticus TaxID=1775131 RepID=A0ABX0DFK7_9ACTN|nr:DUF6303 family protein [Streptomyces ureilyticus]NGO40648.1 hypothetical protein [Streptomyces ureilyticus]